MTDALNVRQTNVVVRKIREIEKRKRNLIVCNIPESTYDDPEESDEKEISDIFKDLNIEQIRPLKVIRVGVKGRYPRKTLVVLQSVDECERLLQSAENKTLKNDIFITRDRTYNQRQEARQYRLEREKEEQGGIPSQRGRPRG